MDTSVTFLALTDDESKGRLCMKQNNGQFMYASSFCVSAPQSRKKDGTVLSNMIVGSFGPCVKSRSLDLIIGGPLRVL